MDFWLVRHALPLVPAGTCYGALDVAVDSAHTQETASRLAGFLPASVRVWTSPQVRCRALGDALQALRPDLQTRADDRLREMDFGHWEGKAWDAIPASAFDEWMRDFLHVRFGGAESVSELLQRVRAAWHDAQAETSPMLWITHAGVIRSLALIRDGQPPPATARDWPRESLGFGESVHWKI
jgi:alpha-ribazole phosphatase